MVRRDVFIHPIHFTPRWFEAIYAAILPSMVSMRASGTLWPLAQHPIATSLYINGVHMVCLSHGTAWNIPNGITTEPPHRRTRDGASRSVLCDNVVPALPRIFASHPKSPASHSEKWVCGGGASHGYRKHIIGKRLLESSSGRLVGECYLCAILAHIHNTISWFGHSSYPGIRRWWLYGPLCCGRGAEEGYTALLDKWVIYGVKGLEMVSRLLCSGVGGGGVDFVKYESRGGWKERTMRLLHMARRMMLGMVFDGSGDIGWAWLCLNFRWVWHNFIQSCGMRGLEENGVWKCKER